MKTLNSKELIYLKDFFNEINFGDAELEKLSKMEQIFCLVSGGVDSTLLAIFLYTLFKEKVIFVNNFNPYENSPTLNYFKSLPNCEVTKSKEKQDYLKVLRNSFLKLPEAKLLRKKKIYGKWIFECCYHIKHKFFNSLEKFKRPNTCVVSGIKAGDGRNRRIFLSQMRAGKRTGIPSFFLLHKNTNILYVYPYRDFTKKDFNKTIMKFNKTFP